MCDCSATPALRPRINSFMSCEYVQSSAAAALHQPRCPASLCGNCERSLIFLQQASSYSLFVCRKQSKLFTFFILITWLLCLHNIIILEVCSTESIIDRYLPVIANCLHFFNFTVISLISSVQTISLKSSAKSFINIIFVIFYVTLFSSLIISLGKNVFISVIKYFVFLRILYVFCSVLYMYALFCILSWFSENFRTYILCPKNNKKNIIQFDAVVR